MKALGCRGVRRRLAAFHDGELSLSERSSVRAHLGACRHCKIELRHVATIGSAVRRAAEIRHQSTTDLKALREGIVARLEAERQASWTFRMRDLFDDMHLVWAGVGGAVFTIACVGLLASMFQFGTAERPDSMAAIMYAMASPPGSNVNPMNVSAGQMLLPRGDADRPVWVSGPNDDAVVALAAVVTREGQVSNLEFLQADELTRSGRGTRVGGKREIVELLDAVSRARFAPARGLGDSPIAVNMVWLLAHTTVRGKLHS